MAKRKKSAKGQGFVEAITAAMILIPLALCLLDLIVLVIANQMNDTIVKSAARAAANQGDSNTAWQAAQTSVGSFQKSSFVESVSLDQGAFSYSNNNTGVTCQTTMVVRLPVPFPGFATMTFVAKDVEPIMY